MTTRKYSSRSQQTSLTGALTSSGTTATVVSGAALLGGITVSAGETFTVVIDPDTALEEIVDIYSATGSPVSTNTLTIVRGVENAGIGVAHSAGAIVRHMLTGRDLRESNTHIESTTGHGATGAVVGTTNTQTLTNKTLTSPTITGTGSIAGTFTGNITGNVTGNVSGNAGTVTNGVYTTDTGTVTSTMIANGTIVDADINSSAAIAKTKVSGTAITAADTGTVTSTMIANDTIVNADINTSAQIAYGKLNLTNTIVNADINASAAIDKTKISGTAITAADTGTVTSTLIADGTIVNGDINASAAIALSKLATDPLARANHTGTQTASTISDFDTQVRTSRLDQMAAPTASVSANSQKITNLATPTSNTDAATKAYADQMILATEKGASNGVATLGSDGKLTTAQIPDVTITDTSVVSSQAAMLALTAQVGDVAVRTDINKSFILKTAGASTLANWQELLTPTDSVLSVDGQTGAISLSSTYATVANAANKLPLAGGTMSGNIAMGSNKITGLGTPTTTGDAATKDYADTKLPLAGGTMTGAVAMGTNKITGLGDPTNAQDAATKNYIDTTVIAPSNLTGVITSVGNATSIASKTGTGTKFVVDTSPTLVTPNIGAATATSINGTTIPSSKTLVATDSTAYVVPSQTGNAGKYLKTDGTTSSWGTVEALPSQTSNAGKLLGTDGTTAAWTSTLANPNIENGLKAKIAITGGNGYADFDGNVIGNYILTVGGNAFIGMQYVGNVWLAANYSGSGGTNVYSSTNGITWNYLAYMGGFGFEKDSNCKVAYNGSVFVVSGSGGELGITTNITDYASVATPPTFTDSSQAYRATISSFNGYFLLTDPTGSNIFYSTNGTTWNSSSLPTTALWSSTAYGAGKYVVVANNSATAAYATSPSGTWTSITMPSTGYQSVIYDGTKFIAMGSGTLATSTNGTTWTAQTFTESGKWNMAYSNGGYVAACVDTYLTYILKSTDGITWSRYEIPGGTSTKRNIGYIKNQPASGTLNIIGNSGTDGQVVVSTGNGIRWGSPAAATPTVAGTIYGQVDASNTGIGQNSFDTSILNGFNNIGIGQDSLKRLTTGQSNVIISQNGANITTGYGNVGIGGGALQGMQTGEYNVAIGVSAGNAAFSGDKSTAVGYYAGNNGGTGNSSFGSEAGLYTAGSYNTFIGANAGNIPNQYLDYTNVNVTAIGMNAAPSSKTVNNEITLGNSSISTIRANVTSITSLSDERDKTAIEPLTVGLDFVNELKPVQFEWNMRDGAKVGQADAGFIAQDLVAAEDATGLADYLQLTMRENPDKLEATQGRLIPILVKAIQELSAEVKALKEGK